MGEGRENEPPTIENDSPVLEEYPVDTLQSGAEVYCVPRGGFGGSASRGRRELARQLSGRKPSRHHIGLVEQCEHRIRDLSGVADDT